MTVPNEQDHPPDRLPADSAEFSESGVRSGQVDVEALQTALAAAETRAAESRDLYMRALAEIDNVRKRAARDVEQAHRFALDRFANDLIAVKDSLELGLASAADMGGSDALREGMEATLKLLAKAFENAGLIEVFPQGEVFDPQVHEAMAMQPSAEHVPNTVVQVIQKGYQLNGRLLRPARVIVAREP